MDFTEKYKAFMTNLYLIKGRELQILMTKLYGKRYPAKLEIAVIGDGGVRGYLPIPSPKIRKKYFSGKYRGLVYKKAVLSQR